MGNHEDSFIGNIKNLESFGAKKSTDSSKDYRIMLNKSQKFESVKITV